jgi:hypothetical protein
MRIDTLPKNGSKLLILPHPRFAQDNHKIGITFELVSEGIWALRTQLRITNSY